jgi:hypothetical protein
MGDEWLRRRAKGFRHQMDLGYERFVAPKLFSGIRPEILTREYECEVVGGRTLEGSTVTLLRSGEDIAIVMGNQQVGRVVAEEVGCLYPALDAAHGILDGIVVGIAFIGSSFHIRLLEVA